MKPLWLWGLGGWILTFNFFKMINVDNEGEDIALEWLPKKDTFATMEEIRVFQWIFLSLNLL